METRKVIGTTDEHEGSCENCGTGIVHGVLVATVDSDGNSDRFGAEVWGRDCASVLVAGRTVADVDRVSAVADAERKVIEERSARYRAALEEFEAADEQLSNMGDGVSELSDFEYLWRNNARAYQYSTNPVPTPVEFAGHLRGWLDRNGATV